MTQIDQRYQHVETQYNADQITIQQQPLSLSEKQQKLNRTRMLDRVQATWIDGVLEPSLQGAAQIALELQYKPSAIVTPLWYVLREFDKTEGLSSADVSIVQVYDHANGEVLILGEPGAGKTTLLLELTRGLLERARQDETHPIPVVFSLSSWATRRQPLTEWLASELHSRYQVPLPLATSWIETDQVLPLLDGLDEVAAPHRAACVEAINTYRQAHGLLPTVVCSRQVDYLALSTHLMLRTAVVVQPLTPAQIESYLASGGERLEALQRTLREDADLQALASTPLMLNVLMVAYQGTPHKEVTVSGSLETKQKQIFATYVQRMLTHRSISTCYTPEQILHWLSSLAGQMKRQSQTIFYLEHLHPHWLPENWMLRVYDRLAVWLPGVLMGMFLSLIILPSLFSDYNSSAILLIEPALIGGLLGSLLSRGRTDQQPLMSEEKPKGIPWRQLLQWLVVSTLIGFGSGVSEMLGYNFSWRYGLITGLSTGVYSLLLQVFLGKNATGSPPRTSFSVWRTPWQWLTRSTAVRNGLLVGLMIGLTDMVSVTLATDVEYNLFPWGGLGSGLTVGLANGLCFGIVGAFLSVLLTKSSIAVQSTDRLSWSWRQLGRGLLSKSHTSVAIWLVVLIGLHWLLDVWFYSPHQWDASSVLSRGLSIALVYWLLLGLYHAVSSETLEDQHRRKPNQGIHRSAFNGFVLGLSSAIILGVIYVLSGVLPYFLSQILSTLSSILSEERISLISITLSTGLLVALLNGELACFRHYILRYLLWRKGAVPWHYVPFLDYAAERILLRKVGGGYIFLHRLLLDYFAALETGSVSNEAVESRNDILPPCATPSTSGESTGLDGLSDAPTAAPHSRACPYLC